MSLRRRALMAAGAEDLVLNDLLTLDGIRNTRAGHNDRSLIWEDISGNNHDTVQIENAANMVWAADHAVYDGTNRGQYISHNFFSGLTAATVELVVQITGNGSRYVTDFYQGFIFSNRTGTDSSPSGLHTYSYNATGVSAFVNKAGIGYSSTLSGVAYIAFVFDGDTCYHYLNSVLSHTTSISFSSLSKNTNRIGYELISNTYKGFPNCKLYRIGISSTAFTAEQVADRYARLSQRFNF